MASSVELIQIVPAAAGSLADLTRSATEPIDYAATALLAQTDPAGLVGSLMNTAWLVFLVAIGIGLVIFVHELGHFLAAKWCGVKVEKFYVGFDFPIKIGPIQLPRTLGRFRYGETEYGIGTIPLGGYVKMLGQDDDPRKMEAEARRARSGGNPLDDDEPSENDDIDRRPAQLDPRSFPAKTVWQRMIIISAGVVMNLITGVLFAAAAFLYGVPYQPAVVGDTVPGTPAYAAGVQPGGQVISVGRIDHDDQLHFAEMASAVLLEGTDDPDQAVPVTIRYGETEQRQYQLKTAAVAAQPGRRLVGLSAMNTTFLRTDPEFIARDQSAADGRFTAADAGAEIVAVNDQPIAGAGQQDNVPGSVQLHRALFADPNQPLTLELARTDGSRHSVTVPAQPMLMPPVTLTIGPVLAIVQDGPAADAGVQPGDVLVAVEGIDQPCALALPSQLASLDGTVRFTFHRTSGDQTETIELPLTATEPSRASMPINPLDNTVAIDRFGFAYQALSTVAAVRTDGKTPADGDTPADDTNQPNGFQPGDAWKKVQVRWGDQPRPAFLDQLADDSINQTLQNGWEFDPEHTLAMLVDLWQLFPPDTQLTVFVSRDGKIVEVDTSLRNNGHFWPDRGLRTNELQRIQVGTSLGNSLALGYHAAERRFTEVFRVLGMLVTQKANTNMIGGPITIFRVAGQEASRGIPTLLMFLTMLSMNLAILNFLPIPALDGGHMVFLIAEAVLGRPINERLQMQLTMAGVLALLSLMAFAVLNDLRRW